MKIGSRGQVLQFPLSARGTKLQSLPDSIVCLQTPPAPEPAPCLLHAARMYTAASVVTAVITAGVAGQSHSSPPRHDYAHSPQTSLYHALRDTEGRNTAVNAKESTGWFYSTIIYTVMKTKLLASCRIALLHQTVCEHISQMLTSPRTKMFGNKSYSTRSQWAS